VHVISSLLIVFVHVCVCVWVGGWVLVHACVWVVYSLLHSKFSFSYPCFMPGTTVGVLIVVNCFLLG